MSLAEDVAFVDAVGEIDEQIVAVVALETGRVPHHLPHAGRGHADALHLALAALADAARGRVLRHAYVQGHVVSSRYEILKRKKIIIKFLRVWKNLHAYRFDIRRSTLNLELKSRKT